MGLLPGFMPDHTVCPAVFWWNSDPPCCLSTDLQHCPEIESGPDQGVQHIVYSGRGQRCWIKTICSRADHVHDCGRIPLVFTSSRRELNPPSRGHPDRGPRRGSGMVRMAFQRVRMDPFRHRKPGPRNFFRRMFRECKDEKRE